MKEKKTKFVGLAHPPEAEHNGIIPSLQRRIFDILYGFSIEWPQKEL